MIRTVIVALCAFTSVARGNEDAVDVSTPMTELGATDPCTQLAAGLDPQDQTTCLRVASIRLQRGTTASLYRLRNETKASFTRYPLWTRYAVMVTSDGQRWLSQTIEVGYASKLGGAFSEVVEQHPRLRVIQVQEGSAAALELTSIHRANMTESEKGTSVGSRSWTNTAFIVCANHDGWSCLAASFGTWQTPPCTASLSKRGVLSHACEEQDELHF